MLVLYEEKKYQESLDRFSAFASEFPDSELKEDSELKMGEMLSRLKRYDESRERLSRLIKETRI